MDMIMEHYDATREFFTVLGMVKLAVDFGIEQKDLEHCELVPQYIGTTVDVMSTFCTILTKVDGFELEVTGYYDEEYEVVKKDIFQHSIFSFAGVKAVEKFDEKADLLIFQINSERLDDFPFELAGNRLNVDGCATIGKTPSGIVIIFAMDYGEPDYPTALQEVLENVKKDHETERT